MEEQLLNRIPLFASLTSKEKSQVLNTIKVREFPAGTVFLHEGETGTCFYFILEGQVEIVKAKGAAEERRLGRRGPGEFLGEMSLFTPDGRRSASVLASEAVVLLEMSHANFQNLLHRFPKLVQEMLRVMSMRLRETNASTLRDLRQKNRQLAEAYQELLTAQAQIIEKEKLERELQLAREIQMAYLPQELPAMRGFDFGARMLPARAVGGDYYDFIPLDEGLLGVVVADVADKGVPAAIMMALSRSILRAEANGLALPGDTLRAVNGHLLEMNESGLFLTVNYGRLDQNNRTFSYARAGHEFPMLIDPGGNIVSVPHGPGQPIGFLPDPLMDVQTLSLEPGSTLFIFTDGLLDAMNAQDDFFGPERLHQSIDLSQTSAQELCDAVIGKIQDFQGSNTQFDDMTLVVIRSLE
jgi:sigma-B regulation protein RsbU (phosphoserine phosphatase)